MLFCLGVMLRFTPQKHSEVEASMQLAERLVLIARFGPPFPDDKQKFLLQVARALESDQEARLRVIDGKDLNAKQIESLPAGYRAMAEYREHPTAQAEAGLRERARQAQSRLVLCSALVSGIVICALGLAFLGRTEAERSPLPMSMMTPLGVLSIFLGWDVAQLFGLSPILGASGLRNVLPPMIFVVTVQAMVYGLMLLLFHLARRGQAQVWNLSFPFPSAWTGRSYFACYALIYPLNLLIGVMSGHSPSSSNPLLEMFMKASTAQVVALALLVVVVGPFFEELMFRGWLLGGLRERWGDRKALLVSAALFAVIHGDPWATPALFLLGCVFGWVYLRTGSLWGSIALHAMWNATTFTFLLANMP